jgi:hypothetical protein
LPNSFNHLQKTPPAPFFKLTPGYDDKASGPAMKKMREIKTLVKQGALALLFLPLLAGTAAACPKGKKCDNVANKGKKLEEGGSKIGEKDPDSGGKKSTHKPTNKKGPLSIQAVERLNATNAAIESEREAGTRDVSAAPEAGTCMQPQQPTAPRRTCSPRPSKGNDWRSKSSKIFWPRSHGARARANMSSVTLRRCGRYSTGLRGPGMKT